MGVAWVFEYKGSAAEVEGLLELNGADIIGPYSVDCLPYNPTQQVGGGVCYVLHHSQFPQTSFAISPIDNNLKCSPKATCDRGFDLILTKMSNGLTPDTQAKFECSGQEFRFRDFVVRVGTSSQVTTVKGVIVEVDYEPCMLAMQALPMLTEFMTSHFPKYMQKPEIINKTTPEPYGTLDTIFQYLLLFRAMRGRSAASTNGIFSMIRRLPWVKRKLVAELERVKQDMEEDIHQNDRIRDFYKFLPEHGSKVEEILAEAEQYIQMSNYKQTKLDHELMSEAESEMHCRLHELFAGSEPTKANVFPGVRKMEIEIIRMISSMFHASSDACGVVATEYSETLLLMCVGYRRAALEKGAVLPTIITPYTSHPILDQAAQLFAMRVIRVPVDENGEFDPELIRKQCDSNTCAVYSPEEVADKIIQIVISAPNAITGSTDPIETIAEIARSQGVPLHIDCQLGGFILPFMEHCDFSLPSFDFRLPGVTSVSVDLRKFGRSPSSCSVILYRDASHMKRQCFVQSGGPEGMHWSTTITGTRDGASVASAWATLLINGRDRYLNECQKIVETTRRLADLLLSIDGICLKGSADLCVVAFSHEKVDIYDVIDCLNKKGWEVDPLVRPKAARLLVTRAFCEEGVLELFVRDVASAVIQLVGVQAPKKSRLSVLYTTFGSISDEGLRDAIVYQRLLAQYSMTPAQERQTRTLSVEGRKMSFIAAAEAAKLVHDLRARQESTK